MAGKIREEKTEKIRKRLFPLSTDFTPTPYSSRWISFPLPFLSHREGSLPFTSRILSIPIYNPGLYNWIIGIVSV